MCYSGRVQSKWKRYVQDMEARMSWSHFHDLAQRRLDDPAQYRLINKNNKENLMRTIGRVSG
jgi:hypothetical protein